MIAFMLGCLVGIAVSYFVVHPEVAKDSFDWLKSKINK